MAGAEGGGNALLAQLARERAARQGSTPVPVADAELTPAEQQGVETVRAVPPPESVPAAQGSGSGAEGAAAFQHASETLPAGSPPAGAGGGGEAAREALDCPLCMRLFCDPVTLQCGHTFCRACFAQSALVGSSPSCPMCRAPVHVNAGDLGTNYTLSKLAHALFPAAAAERAAEAVSDAVDMSRRTLLAFFLPTPYMPRQRLQLMVFEPRYLELVNRVMAGARQFVVLPPPGDEAVEPVGAIVRVDDVAPAPGARLYLRGTVQALALPTGPPIEVLDAFGLCEVPLEELGDVPLGEDDAAAAITRPRGAPAAVDTAEDDGTFRGVGPLELAHAYRAALAPVVADCLRQLGPANAAALAATHGPPPPSPQQLSQYLTGVLDLPPAALDRCRRGTSTLCRLAEVYSYLAAAAEPRAAAEGDAPAIVPPLGAVRATAVLTFCKGGNAWVAGVGQALAKPTAVQGVLVLLAVFAALAFFAAQ